MNHIRVGSRPARVETRSPRRRRRAGRLIVLAAVAAGCKYTPYAPTEPPLPAYTIQQLGLLPGGAQSQATAGSDVAIVGWGADAGGVHHAVTFSSGAATRLAEPAGTLNSEANGVNASGVITGFVTLLSGVQQGVVWSSPTATPVVLPSLGGPNTFAHGINNSNWVLGTAQTDSGDTVLVTWSPSGPGPGYAVTRFDTAGGVDYQAIGVDDPGDISGNLPAGQGAFLWDDDDGLLNVTPASAVTAANGMNNYGIQAGAIVNSPTSSTAYVFTGTIGVVPLGVPPAGYTNVVANAISDHGIIAGTASTVDGAGNTLTSIPVLGTVVNPAQAFTALPTLGGSLAQSVGMTGCGVILGWATQSGSSAHLATAWLAKGCTLP